MTQNRQPRGTPVGGEFAEHAHDESDVSLDIEEFPAPPAGPAAFTFPASKLPDALHRIEKANNRLKRAGIEERFTYETETSYRVDDKTGLDIEMTKLTLNKPAIGHDGWTFVGAHDFTPDGQPIAAYRKDAAVPDALDTRCDQCGVTRSRDRVYTLRNEDGDLKQVGSSCLSAFLGVKPAGLWALEYDLEEGDEDPDSDEFARFARESTVYGALDLVAAGLVVSDGGKSFVSRSASDFETPATVDTVLRDFSVLREKLTEENIRDAKKIIKWLKKQPADGDYIANLKAALVQKGDDEKRVNQKHTALAVSVIGSYRRAMERELGKKIRVDQKAKEVKGYLATPTEKVKDITATVQLVRHFETNYGYYPSTSTMIVMIADSGHVLKWTASSFKELEEGARVTISGTVKANEVYNETWQTVLTRAKVLPVEGESEMAQPTA